VAERGRRLHRQEPGVQTTELLHGPNLIPFTARPGCPLVPPGPPLRKGLGASYRARRNRRGIACQLRDVLAPGGRAGPRTRCCSWPRVGPCSKP
jgi:hypothetical protein